MSKDRPILFSAPMVNAYRAGAKTQTRRTMSAQPRWLPEGDGMDACWEWTPYTGSNIDHPYAGFTLRASTNEMLADLILKSGYVSPYGTQGDRLWVREAWGFVNPDGYIVTASTLNYRSDGAQKLVLPEKTQDYVKQNPNCVPRMGWRPSIHMPRWASRDTLGVVDVRVERLQDISEADAMAEGIVEVPFRPDDGWPMCVGYCTHPNDGAKGLDVSPVETYQTLWESINGKGSWHDNPWVWVVEFERKENDHV